MLILIMIEPYYQDEYCTIYNADCRDVLPQLERVDLVLTDPPYGVAYETARRSRHDKLRVKVVNDETLDCFAAAWPLALERLKQDRHWYVFGSPRKIHEMAAICRDFKHIIAWDKGDRGTVGDLECGFGEAWEAIFYGMKGRRKLNGSRPRTVIRQDWSSVLDARHPTVKPTSLLKKLIKWSAFEGETILDPFMGSGTTLRAAKDLGLKAIGIEIERKYCDIAIERLRQQAFSFEAAS